MSPDSTPAAGDDAVQAAAARLAEAARTMTPCAPVRDLVGEDDVESAYAVQQILTKGRLDSGARIVGRKIGLTSPAVQAQLGVDQPDFGVLFDDMEVFGTTPLSRLIQPKVEAEVAFVLGADLADGPLDADQCREAVESACAAIEIVDSRVQGWDIRFGDTVSDNASSGLYVLGERRVPLSEVDPKAVTMMMSIDGEQVSEGDGAACLGDPINALAWLARTARDLGDPLKAGDVVLSGALGPMAAVPGPCVVTTTIEGLGEVSTRFVDDAAQMPA